MGDMAAKVYQSLWTWRPAWTAPAAMSKVSTRSKAKNLPFFGSSRCSRSSVVPQMTLQWGHSQRSTNLLVSVSCSTGCRTTQAEW